MEICVTALLHVKDCKPPKLILLPEFSHIHSHSANDEISPRANKLNMGRFFIIEKISHYENKNKNIICSCSVKAYPGPYLEPVLGMR